MKESTAFPMSPYRINLNSALNQQDLGSLIYTIIQKCPVSDKTHWRNVTSVNGGSLGNK